MVKIEYRFSKVGVMGFQLRDWNDAKLLLAVAEMGSFAAVATALGMDQVTVSRRIGALEAAAGRPLFTRKRSGAKPTAAGLRVIEAAAGLARSVQAFEGALVDLDGYDQPSVTISASEGVLNFLLKPSLAAGVSSRNGGPLADHAILHDTLPPLAFSELSATRPAFGDITIVPTAPREVPRISGRFRVRRIGTMSFFPVASRKLLKSIPTISGFDDLLNLPLIDNGTYRGIRSMAEWHGLVSRAPQVIRAETTSDAIRPLKAANGITLLPGYAPLLDRQGVVLDLSTPLMAVDLWATAHEDTLREPAVRKLYDGIAQMFLGSPWFKLPGRGASSLPRLPEPA
jgi:DNA-binding transcriptional LysR family regulator